MGTGFGEIERCRRRGSISAKAERGGENWVAYTISHNSVDLRPVVVTVGQEKDRVAYNSHSMDLGACHGLSRMTMAGWSCETVSEL